MKLADKPCYPFDIEFEMKDGYGSIRRQQSSGLTFKERLVIALASNGELFQFYYESNNGTFAEVINKHAVDIIAELEEEK